MQSPARGAAVLLGLLAGVAVLAPARSGAEVASHPKIGGLLACTPRIAARWPWSGAWVFPVGDSLDLSRPVNEVPGYNINRNVIHGTPLNPRHDGADLSNGLAGGRVRAAASGVVVSVGRIASGYGTHLVLAHHLDDGSLVYTVYAHLISRSVRVREGAVVSAGQRIARVGQTGRATSPHLHFEVRVPKDSTLRWENCRVVDPVAFIRDRLPTQRPDSDWSTPYVAWAEFAALVPRGIDPATPLDSTLFARALERAGARDKSDAPRRSDAASRGRSGGRPGWNTIARGLAALSATPGRLRPCPIEVRRYGRTCKERLGVRRPARELHELAGRDEPPTVGDLCLALADFAPRPTPAKPTPAKKRSPELSATR